MYIITNKDNIIFNISETKDYQENGNLLVNNGKLAIPQDLIGGIFEVASIPEEVEVEKYCYTETDGFYKNENYKQYYSNEDRISALEDAVNMLLGF